MRVGRPAEDVIARGARARRPSRLRAGARLRRHRGRAARRASPRSARRTTSTGSPRCSGAAMKLIYEKSQAGPAGVDAAAARRSRRRGAAELRARGAAAAARDRGARARPALHGALDAHVRHRHRLLSARLLHDEAQPEGQRARRRAAGLPRPAPAPGRGGRAGRARAHVAARRRSSPRSPGLHAVSLQPAAGSQGELTGLMLMRAYFADRGERAATRSSSPTRRTGRTPPA